MACFFTKLKLYREEYELIKVDIGHYAIAKNEHDLIIAVSALEHVESKEVFENVVKKSDSKMGKKNKKLNLF